ncbi:MAG: hypothetical protein GY757_41500 [bacterium]|nr:hypothetical protein [bacterium]
MKKYLVVFTVLIAMLLLPGDMQAQEGDVVNYGHISYMEANPTIIRLDGIKQDAVVNLPIVPGDVIVTGDKAKCEFQFANGTVMRIGANSRVKVVTILANTLTTKWKITTLNLKKGSLYALSNTYNREKFQVITPNAAINLKSNTVGTIEYTAAGETNIFTERGKAKVLFGKDEQALQTEVVRSDKGYTVTADHRLKPNTKRNVEFVAWNQYIDRNFQKLHRGQSKVPKQIYRYNKAIIHFAEKFSNLFGEWVYDELFGYVWKPGHKDFAYSHRPFFNANFVTINGQMYVVPQEKWGWAPAHLGTWVWLKKSGWRWIPGNAFSPGLMQMPSYYHSAEYLCGGYFHPSLYYWYTHCYGGWDLYCIHRRYGRTKWRDAYKMKYKKLVKKPALKKMPRAVAKIFKRLDKLPLDRIKKHLGEYTPQMKRPAVEKILLGDWKKHKGGPIVKRKGIAMKKAVAAKPGLVAHKRSTKIHKLKSKTTAPHLALAPDTTIKIDGVKVKGLKWASRMGFRDWSPDRAWARRKGMSLHYARNQVVCPKLRVTSNMLTNGQKRGLRDTRLRALTRHRNSSSRGGGSSYSSSSGTSTSGSGRVAGSGGSSSKGSSTGTGASGGRNAQK